MSPAGGGLRGHPQLRAALHRVLANVPGLRRTLIALLGVGALVAMSSQVMAQDPPPIFDADAAYRIAAPYGITTEIDLEGYLADGVTGATFSLKACDSSRADYYSSASVSSGTLTLISNTLGHAHGSATETETTCTVTATTTDSATEDREFSFHMDSWRTPVALQPGSLTVAATRVEEIDVQLSVDGENNYVRLGWRKSGGSATFRLVSGLDASTTLTIPNLEEGTEYEIRAYLVHRQSFDLYRAGNTGAAGTLIAEGSPAAKWTRNLTGNGLGKSASVSAATLARQVGASVSITPATATVAEGDTVTITLTLSATFSADVVIPLSVAGTAGSGDYSGVPTSVTINANTRTQTFTLNAVADSVADTGETVIISIDSDHATFPDDLTVGTPDTSTITITDDPTVTITPATATVAEGDTVTITLTLSATFDADVVIPLSVAGTASSGDYSGVPTSVTINANTRTQTFTLNAVADSVADTGETVIISIDSDHATFGDDLTVGTPDTSTITITDDPTVTITPATATVAEGDTTSL